MGQTEKYYRKYRKYKKQYLYYKQYLGGTAQAQEAIIEAKRREQELKKTANLEQGEKKVEVVEDKAAANDADDAAGSQVN